jgi:hypothetical protein
MSTRHRHCIYLLHVTETDGSVWHYVGATARSRLKTRLYEHRVGKGAALTDKASQRGAKIDLGWYTYKATRHLEAPLTASPITPSFCGMCKALETGVTWIAMEHTL